jgi:hypothetical protein
VDDRNENVFKILMQNLFDKLFGDKGYISAAKPLYEYEPDCRSRSLLFFYNKPVIHFDMEEYTGQPALFY